MQAGLGLDVKIYKHFTLRGEGREFWSGVPQLNVNTGARAANTIFSPAVASSGTSERRSRKPRRPDDAKFEGIVQNLLQHKPLKRSKVGVSKRNPEKLIPSIIAPSARRCTMRGVKAICRQPRSSSQFLVRQLAFERIRRWCRQSLNLIGDFPSPLQPSLKFGIPSIRPQLPRLFFIQFFEQSQFFQQLQHQFRVFGAHSVILFEFCALVKLDIDEHRHVAVYTGRLLISGGPWRERATAQRTQTWILLQRIRLLSPPVPISSPSCW